jgi:uncharacterized protein (DUF1684 family)
MKLARRLIYLLAGVIVMLAGCSGLRPEQTTNNPDYLAEITTYRQERDYEFRTNPFTRLALVHRRSLKESTRQTVGSGPKADVSLNGDGIAAIHAAIERTDSGWVLRSVDRAAIWSLDDPPAQLTELALQDGTGFRIGSFNLRYIDHVSWGEILEVYDTRRPALVGFTGLDYFPVDPAYRVVGEVVPYPTPEPLSLIDSQGNQRPYILYGELHFDLRGTPCQLELYTTSSNTEEIESNGFMLMFTDATSGKESYPAARYLDVEGKTVGEIVVDFNRAYSPPCSYSPVFTCPFPRAQNRLPVAVEAGQKWNPGDSAKLGAKGSD